MHRDEVGVAPIADRRRAPLHRRALGLLPAASWTAADQVSSSLISLLISAAVARAGGARLLGAFALAFTAYLLVLGVQRALVTEPLMSLPSRGTEAPRAALGCSVVLGVLAGASSLVAGLVADAPGLTALGAVLPVLLLQDAVRFTAFQRQDARGAAAVDMTWLAVLAASWPLLTAAESVTVPVLLWGGGALAGLLVGLVAAGLRPAPPAVAWRWWRRDGRRYGGLLAVESIVHSLATQALVVGLAGLIGVAELGRLRAAQLLLGVAGTALVAFNVFVLPRLTARPGVLSARQAAGLCLAAAAVAAAAVGASLAAAPLLQAVLLGDAVEVGAGLLLPVGLALVVGSAPAGLLLHMKALRRVGGYTVGRLVVALVGTPGVLAAAAVGGLRAAAWAMVVQAVLYGLGDLVAWSYARRATASA